MRAGYNIPWGGAARGEEVRLEGKDTRPAPHTLRHTCAANMLRAGANLVEVASVLGHARLDTTAVYTRPALGDMEKALERGEV